MAKSFFKGIIQKHIYFFISFTGILSSFFYLILCILFVYSVYTPICLFSGFLLLYSTLWFIFISFLLKKEKVFSKNEKKKINLAALENKHMGGHIGGALLGASTVALGDSSLIGVLPETEGPITIAHLQQENDRLEGELTFEMGDFDNDTITPARISDRLVVNERRRADYFNGVSPTTPTEILVSPPSRHQQVPPQPLAPQPLQRVTIYEPPTPTSPSPSPTSSFSQSDVEWAQAELAYNCALFKEQTRRDREEYERFLNWVLATAHIEEKKRADVIKGIKDVWQTVVDSKRPQPTYISQLTGFCRNLVYVPFRLTVASSVAVVQVFRGRPIDTPPIFPPAAPSKSEVDPELAAPYIKAIADILDKQPSIPKSVYLKPITEVLESHHDWRLNLAKHLASHKALLENTQTVSVNEERETLQKLPRKNSNPSPTFLSPSREEPSLNDGWVSTNEDSSFSTNEAMHEYLKNSERVPQSNTAVNSTVPSQQETNTSHLNEQLIKDRQNEEADLQAEKERKDAQFKEERDTRAQLSLNNGGRVQLAPPRGVSVSQTNS